MEMKKSRKIILTVIGIIVALYTLFPFCSSDLRTVSLQARLALRASAFHS